PRVPEGVADDALELGQLRPQPAEAAAEAVATERPVAAPLVSAEDRALRPALDEPLAQLDHGRRQVDDPRQAGLLPGLLVCEHPDAELQVDVLGRDLPHLAGPAAGLAHRRQEVLELLVTDGAEEMLPLLGRQHPIAA